MADERTVPAPRRQRRLPALVRFLVVATLGALVAGLTSYLLRKIGF